MTTKTGLVLNGLLKACGHLSRGFLLLLSPSPASLPLIYSHHSPLSIFLSFQKMLHLLRRNLTQFLVGGILYPCSHLGDLVTQALWAASSPLSRTMASHVRSIQSSAIMGCWSWAEQVEGEHLQLETGWNIISCLSCCSDDENSLTKARIYLGPQSIIVGESWPQELGAAGHTASVVRKQWEMNAHAQFTVSFSLSPRLSSLEHGDSIAEVGLPTSINLIQILSQYRYSPNTDTPPMQILPQYRYSPQAGLETYFLGDSRLVR